MVQLEFCPYTQTWRLICTSGLLWASTVVSPGFILFRYSSPSFGYQHVCSHLDLSPERLWPVDIAPCVSRIFHFHLKLGFAILLLTYMLDSLVCVPRQGKENHSPSITSVYRLSTIHSRTGKIYYNTPEEAASWYTISPPDKSILAGGKPQRPHRKRCRKYDWHVELFYFASLSGISVNI